jgi:hypothetical protein
VKLVGDYDLPAGPSRESKKQKNEAAVFSKSKNAFTPDAVAFF